MAKNKTTETESSVEDFINSIAEETKRMDSFRIVDVFKNQTGFEPKMWGPSIIGFGSYHYKYESGHEGDAPLVGFSPRKSAFSLYIPLFEGRDVLLETFGKHKTAKGCVYINKVDDIDTEVLKKMITGGLKYMKDKYP